MKKSAILLLVMFVILACDKKQVYRDFENKMESQRWAEKNVKTHHFEIVEDGKNYIFLLK